MAEAVVEAAMEEVAAAAMDTEAAVEEVIISFLILSS